MRIRTATEWIIITGELLQLINQRH